MSRTRTSRQVALLVDDDAMLRLLAAQALEQAGLRVVEAASGEEALTLAAREQPDIVLLDVQLPGIDGFAVCTALRRDPSLAYLPILMMTGLEDTESVSCAYEAGATDFVTKPVHWQLLGHRVRYLLRSSDAFRQLSESRAQLAKSESLLAAAHRIARIATWEWNATSGRLDWSLKHESVFGEHVALPTTLSQYYQLVHPDDLKQVKKRFGDAVESRTGQQLEHRIIDAQGQVRLVELQFESRAPDDGSGSIGLYGTARDLTDRWRAEQRIQQLAYFDTLTGLPNRQLFKQQATKAIEQATLRNSQLGFLFVDLDRFKRINDTLGHGAGDTLLRIVAERMQGAVRGRGGVRLCDLVGRLGGDEFVAMVTDLPDRGTVLEVAERLLETLRAPFLIEGQELYLSGSIGVATFPSDGSDYDSLLRKADSAMYQAKISGRDTAKLHVEAHQGSRLERLSLERDLRHALSSDDQLMLYYQPQVNTSSGRIIGAEALLRWQHPQRGLVTPDDILPIAEDAGLMVSLGGWVIEAVCQALQRWQAAGLAVPRVAINMTAESFEQPGLVDQLDRAVSRYGVARDRLELEITESLLLRPTAGTLDTLHALRDRGIRLAIDDFGTGYSSLAYLKRFPLNLLKIDRSFIAGLPCDGAITQAIIGLASGMGLEVLAEGVETHEQADALKSYGCDTMQGYLFHHPLTERRFAELLDVLPTTIPVTATVSSSG